MSPPDRPRNDRSAPRRDGESRPSDDRRSGGPGRPPRPGGGSSSSRSASSNRSASPNRDGSGKPGRPGSPRAAGDRAEPGRRPSTGRPGPRRDDERGDGRGGPAGSRSGSSGGPRRSASPGGRGGPRSGPAGDRRPSDRRVDEPPRTAGPARWGSLGRKGAARLAPGQIDSRGAAGGTGRDERPDPGHQQDRWVRVDDDVRTEASQAVGRGQRPAPKQRISEEPPRDGAGPPARQGRAPGPQMRSRSW